MIGISVQNMYTLLLLLVAPVLAQYQRFDDGFQTEFSAVNRGRLYNALIYLENLDFGECLFECIRFLSCVSFNYHSDSKMCELTDEEYDIYEADEEAPGWYNYGKGPPKVNGAFTEWIVNSSCSAKCGYEGKQKQIRFCTNPEPSNGGADCVGERTRMVSCIGACPMVTVACSPNTIQLSCPNGKKIKIVYASYGRSDQTTCPYKSAKAMKKTDCHDATSQSVMEGACNGKDSCSMQSAYSKFGGVDPCRGTAKYLSVKHTCE